MIATKRVNLFRICIALAAVMISVLNVGIGQDSPTKALEVSVSPRLPLDPSVICIVMQFHNSGNEEIELRLPPEKNAFMSYKGLRVEFDGAPVQTHLPAPIYSGANPAYPIMKHLKPGDSFEFLVNLNDIFVVPKNWRKVTVKPKPGWGGSIASVCSSVIIEIGGDANKKRNPLQPAVKEELKKEEPKKEEVNP